MMPNHQKTQHCCDTLAPTKTTDINNKQCHTYAS